MECKKQNWKIFIFQWDIFRIHRDKTPIGFTWRRGKVKPHWQRFLTPQPNPFHSCIWIPPHFIGLLQKIRVIVYNYNIVKFTNESSSFENKSLINTFESILKVEISILFFLYIFFQHDSTLKLLKLFKWIFQCYLFL